MGTSVVKQRKCYFVCHVTTLEVNLAESCTANHNQFWWHPRFGTSQKYFISFCAGLTVGYELKSGGGKAITRNLSEHS